VLVLTHRSTHKGRK